MEPLSIQDASLTKKCGSSPGAPAARKNRKYSLQDKALFFEARHRLGSVTAAARELGFNRSTALMWAKDQSSDSPSVYSAEQKAEFFVFLDRLGSVSAAAQELGINTQTAFGWSYALTAVERRPRRRLTARQQTLEPRRAGFLAALERVGNIGVAAREAGITRSQGDSWARAAGVENIKKNTPKRAEYSRLRSAGATQKAAITAVGVNRRTGYRWDQEALAATARVGAGDEPGVAYKCSVIADVIDSKTALLPGMKAAADAPLPIVAPAVPAGAATDAAPPAADVAAEPVQKSVVEAVASVPRPVSLEVLEQGIDGRYLSQQERESIADMLRAKEPIRAIGRALGRSASTISREITRNSHPRLGYQPYGAHRTAVTNRARPKPSKLASNAPLRQFVKDKLLTRWSPEQIAKVLIKEFPDDEQMRVSHETIYQSLYIQARGGLRREVKEALRTGRTRRKTHRNPEERRPRFRDPMVNISERPAEVEDRAVPGHWEGDLITGAHNQSAIATLVERSTRYVMLVHLPGNHTAETVRDGLIKTMSTLPAHLRGSLTWDQGVEMAKHKAFSIATDMDVYFCDPHSPWQRGSNENTNGLLRQYFPKGTDLNAYGPEDLEHVAQELNARPRKTLDWNTPAEQLRDLLIAN